MEAWTCMSKRLDSVGLRCVSNSILCRLSKCKCRTSKWCYYCALFCLFVCDTELQNKCCKQKVQQQTIGRHSDPSDSFSFQTSQTDLCVFVFFFMCIHSTCVFSSKLLCVSMTTSVNCGCPRDSSVKPVNFSYITDTHTRSLRRAVWVPCVHACMHVWDWIAAPPVCCGLFQLFAGVCVTSAPPSRRRPSAKAGVDTPSQSVLRRPTVPSCARPRNPAAASQSAQGVPANRRLE